MTKPNGIEAYVDALRQMASDSIKVEEDDYQGADGLWYCGKCKTKKQGRVEFPWGTITPMMLCECGARERDRLQEEQRIKDLEENYRRFKRDNEKGLYALKEWFDRFPYWDSEKLVTERKNLLRRLCFTEDKMFTWTFDNDDRAFPKISDAMMRYADRFEEFQDNGQGLCLFSNVGTGKSYYAACIANKLIDKGIPCMMTNFDYIRNKVQESFDGRQEFLDRLNSFPLLIVDDFGMEADTKFMQELVFSVIDARARSGLPLIVTTNLTADELKNPVGIDKQRIYSRLLGMSLPVFVEGTDRRRKQLCSNAKDIKDILGL